MKQLQLGMFKYIMSVYMILITHLILTQQLIIMTILICYRNCFTMPTHRNLFFSLCIQYFTSCEHLIVLILFLGLVGDNIIYKSVHMYAWHYVYDIV